MPVHERAHSITCPRCGWSRGVPRQSDVRVMPPLEECPECGCEKLERRSLRLRDILRDPKVLRRDL